MSQTKTSFPNSSSEFQKGQRSPALEFRKGPDDQEITRTLNLRQAKVEFGLSDYQIYSAVHRREIRAIQPGGKGRIYYLEDELRELAKRLKCAYTLAGAA